jgi:polyhydroxyalkanoate synthase
MDTLEVVGQVVPCKKHATGYCLAGTLLAAVAAAMGRDSDKRLASITLLTPQTDFTEPGELGLFIDEGQIMRLENVVWDKGYLDSKHMAGAFQLMNSSDLWWFRLQRHYLLGERTPVTDRMV